MKAVKVRQHARKKTKGVRAHVKKVKTTADQPGAGAAFKGKNPKAATPKPAKAAAPAGGGFVKHKKGSPEAAAHMAKLRAMRKK